MSKVDVTDHASDGDDLDHVREIRAADTRTVQSDTRHSPRMFGALTPQEAIERRWARERERRARENAGYAGDTSGAVDVRLVTTPIRISEIIRALEREARNGSAQAARELRAWLAEYPQDDAQLDLASMKSELRRRILARLVAEVEAEEAANEAGR